MVNAHRYTITTDMHALFDNINVCCIKSWMFFVNLNIYFVFYAAFPLCNFKNAINKQTCSLYQPTIMLAAVYMLSRTVGTCFVPCIFFLYLYYVAILYPQKQLVDPFFIYFREQIYICAFEIHLITS